MVLVNECNSNLQVLRASATRKPIGTVAPLLRYALLERVIVILIPSAIQVFTVVLIIACFIIHIVIVARGLPRLIVVPMLVS